MSTLLHVIIIIQSVSKQGNSWQSIAKVIITTCVAAFAISFKHKHLNTWMETQQLTNSNVITVDGYLEANVGKLDVYGPGDLLLCLNDVNSITSNQVWKLKPVLGFWPRCILTFQDLNMLNQFHHLNAKMVTLVKSKSGKVRTNQRPRVGFSFHGWFQFVLSVNKLRCNKWSVPYLYIKRGNEMTGEIRKRHIVHVRCLTLPIPIVTQ